MLGVLLFSVGLGTLLVGALVPTAIQKAIDRGLYDAVVLESTDSKAYKGWHDNSENPVDVVAYLHDIINPLEVMNGEVPVIVERGPYVYKEYRTNFYEKWSTDRTRVQRKLWTRYVFDPVRSVESDESRNVTIPNPIFAAFRATLLSSPYGKSFLSLFYDIKVPTAMVDRLFTRVTPREVLFGYTDPVLQYIKDNQILDVDTRFPGYISNKSLEQAQKDMKIDEFYTGVGDTATIRQYVLYQNNSEISSCLLAPCPPNPFTRSWASDEASKIYGSDSSQFSPPISRDSKLPVFFDAFSRSMQLEYLQDYDYKGIKCQRFIIPKRYWSTSKIVPANADFFQFEFEGTFNFSSLSSGVPSFLSKPRYVDADKRLVNGVIGAYQLTPTDVESYFDVEPRSGATMHLRTTSQLNSGISALLDMPTLDPNNRTDWFPLVKDTVVPVFWAINEVGASDSDAADFVNQVYGADHLANAVNISGVIVGSILLIGSLYVMFTIVRHYWRIRNGAGLPLSSSSSSSSSSSAAAVSASSSSPTGRAATESSSLLDGDLVAQHSSGALSEAGVDAEIPM